ncbi:MAG: dienelactone hydrolase family protein [Acidobacteria bacterium]|nr:dienelactone hydrolase family protein [Acidobacteriota bacterium]
MTIQELTDAYRKGQIDRRQFLGRLSLLLGSYATVHQYLETSGMAAGLISSLESARANINTADITFPSAEFSIGGYLCLPAESGKPNPAVIVIHENRGLNEHIRDVARRFAAEGYVALAPDLISRKGGTASAENPDKARELIGSIKPEEATADLLAAHGYLKQRPDCQGQPVASVGFCWGGARSFLLACADPDLNAAVVFYGTTPEHQLLDAIQCPVLGIYAELDTRITSQVAVTADAMKARNKPFTYKIYPGTQHAFFNDTNPERYSEAAARDAWQVTLSFLEKYLKRN